MKRALCGIIFLFSSAFVALPSMLAQWICEKIDYIVDTIYNFFNLRQRIEDLETELNVIKEECL